MGIPKRSVLEPLLFLIYVNDMPLQIQNASLLQFADHTCMICCGNDHTQVNDFLCSDLDSLTKWITTSKMQVNVEKSDFLLSLPSPLLWCCWKVLLYWMWVSKNTWESLLIVMWLRLTMLLMFARRWHITYNWSAVIRRCFLIMLLRCYLISLCFLILCMVFLFGVLH